MASFRRKRLMGGEAKLGEGQRVWGTSTERINIFLGFFQYTTKMGGNSHMGEGEALRLGCC